MKYPSFFFSEKKLSNRNGGFAWKNVPPARRINYCMRGKSTAYTFFRATADIEIWLASMSEIVFNHRFNRSPATRWDDAFTIGGGDISQKFRKLKLLKENKNTLIIIILKNNNVKNRVRKSHRIIVTTITEDDLGHISEILSKTSPRARNVSCEGERTEWHWYFPLSSFIAIFGQIWRMTFAVFECKCYTVTSRVTTARNGIENDSFSSCTR